MTIVTALSILLYPDAQSRGQKQWRKTLLSSAQGVVKWNVLQQS